MGKKKNILVISQYYYPDSFIITSVAEKLVKLGNNVRVLTGLPNYTASVVPREYKFFRRRKESINDVFVRRVPIIARRRGVFFRMLNYLSFVIFASLYALFDRTRDIDAVFVYGTSPVFQGIPAMIYRKRGIRSIHYCCDLWPESLRAWNVKDTSIIYKIVAKISGWVYRSCDIVAITSKPFREYLMRVCGVDGDKIVYLPQYAEDIFSSISGIYEDNGVIDFLFAGNLGAVQDVDCILKATSCCASDKPFCVHIVGNGSEFANLKDLSESLQLGDKVKFYDRRPLDKMPEFYKMANCFLLTLRGGDYIGLTLPSKAQGYLSAGKPILAAIDGAGYELIKEANCGEAVVAGDYQELAKKMQQMIDNFEAYKQKGINGRKFYEENFCVERFMRNLSRLLEG